MGLTLAIGVEYTGQASSNLDADRLYISGGTCAFTGKITQVGARCFANANYHLGLHDDSSGDPNNLLFDSGSIAATSGADATASCNVDVTDSDYIYVTALSDTANSLRRTNNGTTGDGLYKNYTYGALPDPAGTGYFTYTANSWLTFAKGYPLPSVSSLDGDNTVTVGQAGVTLAGANLLDTSGNSVVELCNNADYSSATVKVTQTFNSQTDTTINIDIVQGALSLGTVYAFVTTGLGQRNATGFSVTLVASGETITGVTTQNSVTGFSESSIEAASGVTCQTSVTGLTETSVELVSGVTCQVSTSALSETSVESISGVTCAVSVTGFEELVPGVEEISGVVCQTSVSGFGETSIEAISGVTNQCSVTGFYETSVEALVGAVCQMSVEGFYETQNETISGVTTQVSVDGFVELTEIFSGLITQVSVLGFSETSIEKVSGLVTQCAVNGFYEAGLYPDDIIRYVHVRRNKMVPGKTIKYASTTTLRLEMPATWDRANVSQVAVYVTDEDGTQITSGFATITANTTLDSASLAEDTSVTVASTAQPFVPGDRVRIAGTGEIPEIRKVHSYDADTYTLRLSPELEYDHADGAAVHRMFATYSMDISDTTTYTLSKHFWVSWIPNSQDLGEVQHFIVGMNAVTGGDLWDEFRNMFPNDFERMHGRDLEEFQQFVLKMMKLEMSGKGLDMDRINTTDYLQTGLILLTRKYVLESSGDTDVTEYDRAVKSFDMWLTKVAKLPLWQDTDQDNVVDEASGEIKSYVFTERARYF